MAAVGGPGGRVGMSPRRSPPRSAHWASTPVGMASPRAGENPTDLSMVSTASSVAGRRAMRVAPADLNNSSFAIGGRSFPDEFSVRVRSPPRRYSAGVTQYDDMSHIGSTPAATLPEPPAARTPAALRSSAVDVGSVPTTPASGAGTPKLPTPIPRRLSPDGEATPARVVRMSPPRRRGSPPFAAVLRAEHVDPTDGGSRVSALEQRVLKLEAERDSLLEALEDYRQSTGRALESLTAEFVALRQSIATSNGQRAPAGSPSRRNEPSRASTRGDPAGGRDLDEADTDAAMIELLKQERDAARREAALLRSKLESTNSSREVPANHTDYRDAKALALSTQLKDRASRFHGSQ